MNNTNGAKTGNDKISEPFQPLPTREPWTPQDLNDNRYGTLIRSGLYLKDRKLNSSKIDIIAESIQTEIDERKKADDSLDERVTTLENNQGDIDAWKQPLADEIKARQEGDESLNAKLDDETNARVSGDATLTEGLQKEIADRTSANGILQAELTQETSDRKKADDELDARVTNVSEGLAKETEERKADDLTISQNLEALEAELGTAAYKNTGTNSGEVVILDENGKIADSVIPSFVINQTYVVISEEEMLSLNANVGDIAVRTDINETFFLQKTPASELSNWIQALAPTDGVTSFNGQKGAIVYTPPVTSVNGKTGDVVIESSKQNYFTAYANSADGTDGFTIVYPNLNLEKHTEKLVDESNTLLWGAKGGTTATIAYEAVTIPGNSKIVNGVHVTQTSIGQSGWRSPSGTNGGSIPVVSGGKYTISVYLKNNSSNDVVIDLQLGTSATINQDSPKYVFAHITVPANSDYKKYSTTLTIPSGNSYAWCYAYTKNDTTSADWSFAGYKLEQGSTATSWMPSTSEVTLEDYPKYLGTLLTSNDVQSTDPVDYKWIVNQDTTAIQKAIDDSKGFVGVLPIANGGTGNANGFAQSIQNYDIPANTSLDTYVEAGMFNNSNREGITGIPTGTDGKYFWLEVVKNSSNTSTQKYHDVLQNKEYIRGRFGTTPQYTDWVEIGAGSGGGDTGSIIYGGQFRFGSTNFTGPDTLILRATGIVDNIKGNNSNIVTADPENGVALFTNPTSKPITVILNAGFTLNRTSGTADTLPKKFNIVPVNADIGGGLTDESHLSDTGSVQLTAGGLGATNRNVISPSYFTIPANGKFRLSYSIDGYGAMNDTYTTQATMNYIAFRQDAKTQTEQFNIPWTTLGGSTGGTAGEYKKIGSWTVIRWNIATTTAGNYSLGTITDVSARPDKGFFTQIPVASGTGSETNHLQINQKDNGAVTILNALANKNYSGQVVFNNDGTETVSVPLLANYDINLPNNSITVGKIVDGLGTESGINPDDGVYTEARDVRTLLAPNGLVIQTLDDAGKPKATYRWNTSTGIVLESDVDWNAGFTLASGWSLRGTDSGFMVRNGELFVNINALQTQSALSGNATTLIATVPNVRLFGISRVEAVIFPGTSNRIQGYMEINSSGQIYYHNYDAVPAQTGTNYNQVRCYLKVPIRL